MFVLTNTPFVRLNMQVEATVMLLVSSILAPDASAVATKKFAFKVVVVVGVRCPQYVYVPKRSNRLKFGNGNIAAASDRNPSIPINNRKIGEVNHGYTSRSIQGKV